MFTGKGATIILIEHDMQFVMGISNSDSGSQFRGKDRRRNSGRDLTEYPGMTKLIWEIRTEKMINLAQLVISGIMVGALYGLVAMGFVIIYRGARVFNMAYGQFAMIGAYIAWTFLGSPSAPRLPVGAGPLSDFSLRDRFWPDY